MIKNLPRFGNFATCHIPPEILQKKKKDEIRLSSRLLHDDKWEIEPIHAALLPF